jgi:hypothetical protein
MSHATTKRMTPLMPTPEPPSWTRETCISKHVCSSFGAARLPAPTSTMHLCLRIFTHKHIRAALESHPGYNGELPHLNLWVINILSRLRAVWRTGLETLPKSRTQISSHRLLYPLSESRLGQLRDSHPLDKRRRATIPISLDTPLQERQCRLLQSWAKPSRPSTLVGHIPFLNCLARTDTVQAIARL